MSLEEEGGNILIDHGDEYDEEMDDEFSADDDDDEMFLEMEVSEGEEDETGTGGHSKLNNEPEKGENEVEMEEEDDNNNEAEVEEVDDNDNEEDMEDSDNDNEGRVEIIEVTEAEILAARPKLKKSRRKKASKGKNKKVYEWKWEENADFMPNVKESERGKATFSSHITAASTPLQIFQKMLTPAMADDVKENTNLFVTQRQQKDKKKFKNFEPVSTKDFWQFTALNLLMGIVKKPSMKDYWSTNELLSTPIFGETISRDKFCNILRGLHFTNNETTDFKDNRMKKLGNFFPMLLENFKKLIIIGKNVAIDESLLKFKGRLSFRQYIPSKRARFGIKFFIISDCSTNFIIAIIVYQGKNTCICQDLIKNYGYGGAVVLTLMDDYLDDGICVYIDNWFQSPKITHELFKRGTGTVGTCRKNRLGMPNFGGKLAVGAVEVFSSEHMLVERWCDKKDVIMLSSTQRHMMVSTLRKKVPTKPISILSYNQNMGAVDHADKVTKPYVTERKTIKWYKKVYFHLVDLTAYNSYVIWKSLNPSKDKGYEKFLLDLIREMLEENFQERKPRGRPVDRDIKTDHSRRQAGQLNHLPIRAINSNGKDNYNDCKWCSKSGIRPRDGHRHTTFIKCVACDVHLCVQGNESCFLNYHNVSTLPQKTRKRKALERDEEDEEIEIRRSRYYDMSS